MCPLEEITTQKILFNPSKRSNCESYVPPALTFRSFALCLQNVSMGFYASQNKHLFFLPPQKALRVVLCNEGTVFSVGGEQII